MKSGLCGLFVILSLGMASASLMAMGIQEPQEVPVSFTTEDGITLSGTLTGSGKNLAILSNQHHATGILWSTLVPELVSSGWQVLVYDYRGAGQSGGVESVPDFDRDLRAAYRFGLSQGAKRIVLVGASLGSLVSLKVAAELRPQALVLLSASPSGFGMSLDSDPTKGITSPLLFLTSEYDFAKADTAALAATFGDRAQYLEVPASDHGTALLDGPYGDQVMETIKAFLKRQS